MEPKSSLLMEAHNELTGSPAIPLDPGGPEGP